MKLGSVALCAGMAMALLSKCGTPKPEEIVDKMYETDIESAAIDFLMDAGVSAKYEGDKINISLSTDLGIDAAGISGKNPVIYIEGSVKTEIPNFSDGKQDIEAYYDGDEKLIYFCEGKDDWYYMDADEGDFSFDPEMINAIVGATRDIWKDAEVSKEKEKIGDEDCYILTVQVSGSEFIGIMDSAAKKAGIKDEWEDAKESIEDETGADIADIFDFLTFDVTAYASKENGYFMAADIVLEEVDIDDMMNELDIDLDDLNIKNLSVDAFEIHVTLYDVNQTKVKIDDDIADDAQSYDDYLSGMIVDPDPDPEPEPDPEPDPEPEPDPDPAPVTGSSHPDDFYDEDEGIIYVGEYYYPDDILYELYVPDGFEMYYNCEDGSGCVLEDNNGEYIDIYNYSPEPLLDYIFEGTVPDESYYTNFSATIYPLEDTHCVCDQAYIMYTYFDYSYFTYGTDHETFVFLPYTDACGVDDAVFIQLPSYVTDDEAGDAYMSDILSEMLYLYVY